MIILTIIVLKSPWDFYHTADLYLNTQVQWLRNRLRTCNFTATHSPIESVLNSLQFVETVNIANLMKL